MSTSTDIAINAVNTAVDNAIAVVTSYNADKGSTPNETRYYARSRTQDSDLLHDTCSDGKNDDMRGVDAMASGISPIPAVDDTDATGGGGAMKEASESVVPLNGGALRAPFDPVISKVLSALREEEEGDSNDIPTAPHSFVKGALEDVVESAWIGSIEETTEHAVVDEAKLFEHNGEAAVEDKEAAVANGGDIFVSSTWKADSMLSDARSAPLAPVTHMMMADSDDEDETFDEDNVSIDYTMVQLNDNLLDPDGTLQDSESWDQVEVVKNIIQTELLAKVVVPRQEKQEKREQENQEEQQLDKQQGQDGADDGDDSDEDFVLFKKKTTGRAMQLRPESSSSSASDNNADSSRNRDADGEEEKAENGGHEQQSDEDVSDLLGNLSPGEFLQAPECMTHIKAGLGTLLEVSEEEFDSSSLEVASSSRQTTANHAPLRGAKTTKKIVSSEEADGAQEDVDRTPKRSEGLKKLDVGHGQVDSYEDGPKTPEQRKSLSRVVTPTRKSRLDDFGRGDDGDQILNGQPSRRIRLSLSGGASGADGSMRMRTSIFCARMDDESEAGNDDGETPTGFADSEKRYSVEGMYLFGDSAIGGRTMERVSEEHSNVESEEQEALERAFEFLLECSVIGYDNGAVPNCDSVYEEMVEVCEMQNRSRQNMVDTFINCAELNLQAEALKIMTAHMPPGIQAPTVAALWSSFRGAALVAALFSHPLTDRSTQLKVFNSVGPVREMQSTIQKEIRVFTQMVLSMSGNVNERIISLLMAFPALPQASLHFQPSDKDKLSLYFACTFLSDRGFFLPVVANILNLAMFVYSIWPPLFYIFLLLCWTLKEKSRDHFNSYDAARLRAEAVLLYHSSLPLFITSDAVYLFFTGIFGLNLPNLLLAPLGPLVFLCGVPQRRFNDQINFLNYNFTQKQVFVTFQMAMAVALLFELFSPRNFFVSAPFVIFKVAALWGEKNLYFELLRPEIALACMGATRVTRTEINLRFYNPALSSDNPSRPTLTYLEESSPRPLVQYGVLTLQEMALPLGFLCGILSWCPYTTPVMMLSIVLGFIVGSYLIAWHLQLSFAPCGMERLERLTLLLPKLPEHPDILVELVQSVTSTIVKAYRSLRPIARQIYTQEFSFGLQASDW
eukprot:GEMP01000614.1.p1 GENE.GEMP01000614.1~~GEMP01000614.1.p1  ORF type:complete len:1306 (+),score=269.06 GEMP01000614.1:537-3920(+)